MSREQALPESVRFRPLGPIVRGLLIALGSTFVGIGIIGVYVPGLPTTPFLILAAFCYMRSSERLYNWLLTHPRMGPPLVSFLATRAVSLQVKIFSTVVAWSSLGYLTFFVVERLWVKVALMAVAVVQLSVMLSLKTLKK